MRFLKGIIISTVMIGILLGFSFESSAVPNLQIYIPGATYDTDTETWVINSYEYELWVIGANLTIEDVRFAAAFPEYEDGSIEVTWLDNGTGSGLPDYGMNHGPFAAEHYDISGDFTLTFSESEDDRVGTQYGYAQYLDEIDIPYDPLAVNSYPDPTIYGCAQYDTPVFGDGSDIPDHGVFPTDFYEYYIGDFNQQYFKTVYNYDPTEYDPVTDTFSSTTQGMIKKFDIKVNGYTWVDLVAYDHYLGNKVKYIKSPFSHDGASTPIPEPATLFLLGTGLIGLGWFGKRKTRKEKNR